MNISNITQNIKNLSFRDSTIAIVLFSILFSNYFLTAPGTVALEDDGLFILSSYFLGISHAPGYPLHVLLGKLFTYIPIGSIAFRVHLLSGVFGALTCICLWFCISLIVKNRLIAFIAALSFGFSKTFWSQAIIAEVYTLNTFFFFLLFYIVIKMTNEPPKAEQRGYWYYLIAFIYGLSLTNHWPLMILSTPTLILAGLPIWKQGLRYMPKMAAAFSMGLTPYIWMYFQAQQHPLKILVYPLTTFTEFFAYVSRKVVSQVDSSMSADWTDKLQFGGYVNTEIAIQFSFILFVLIAVGFIIQFRILTKSLVMALLIGFVANTYVLIGLLNFDFDPLFAAVFRVYPLISYGLMSVWLALGIQYVFNTSQNIKLKLVCSNYTKSIIIVLLVLSPFLTHLTYNNRSGYRWAEEYAHLVLNSVEKDAVLFVESDTDVGPIGYAHYVQGIRPDIDIYSNAVPKFIHPLFYPYENLQQFSSVTQILDTTTRPVYYIDSLDHPFGDQYLWLYSKVLRDLKKLEHIFTLTPAMLEKLHLMIIQNHHLDDWTVFHRNQLFTRMIPLLVNKVYTDKTDDINIYQNYLDTISTHIEGKLQIVKESTRYTNDYAKLHKILNSAYEQINESVTKQSKSMYYLVMGDLYQNEDAVESATLSYRKSLETWNHAQNPAIFRLLNSYEKNNKIQERNLLLQRYTMFINIPQTTP